jgi:glucose/arabinose dehydrogenase
MKRKLIYLVAAITPACFAQDVQLDSLRLPDGFSIAVYAQLSSPRQMALGADGVVFVGSIQRGRVYAVVDNDGDGVAEDVSVIAEGLNIPNGVAFHQGDLYIGEINRISKISNVNSRIGSAQKTETLNDSLPNRRHHGFKYLQIGLDNKLYLPVGGPCNVCESEDVFASIHRMNLDGSGMEKVAAGIRNTVGFDWHPQSGELWFTDNGRDMLGDDIPAGEINRITETGQHFGFPYIHQGDLPDPDFGRGKSASDYTPPVYKLGAHVAPLGMTFYRGDSFPSDYRNTVLVAEHGSWNRSRKSGYRVMMGNINASNNEVVSYTPFVEGWLAGQVNWGRPVDVLNMPDGSILISDDLAGVIYRVTYDE